MKKGMKKNLAIFLVLIFAGLGIAGCPTMDMVFGPGGHMGGDSGGYMDVDSDDHMGGDYDDHLGNGGSGHM